MKMKGLYAITDPELIPEEHLVTMVSEAITGGARAVQLRDKEKTDDELFETARRLCLLCNESGVLFIVNDRVELAARVRAHGVHLGKDDVPLADARKIFPGGIIGVSCYNSLERAMEMAQEGANYVAFGSFFPSSTKPRAVRADLSLLRKARARIDIPVCAIGGITPENAAPLVQAGADMIAVIGSLWKPGQILKQAQRFAEMFRI